MTRPRLVSAVKLPAEYESLTFARDVIERGLLSLGWGDDSAARVVLASGEAVCNAIEHGSEHGSDVEVELWAADATAWVQVSDDGRDSSATPVIPPSAPDDGEARGRGLVIMSRLSEDVRISRSTEGGTKVVLRFSAEDDLGTGAAEVA